MLKMVLLFAVLQLINVVLQTCKMIITVKGTTFQSALVNAITYMVYTIVVIYMVADFNLAIKIAVVGITNFIGVYISKAIMHKCKKDKLWEITATAKKGTNDIELTLIEHNIGYNVSPTNSEDMVFHIYTATQKESAVVKKVLNDNQAKYFVHEEEVKL